MKRKMDREDKIALGILITLCTVVIGVLTCAILSTPLGCIETQEQTGRQTKWTFWEGCFVKLNDGQWVPKQNWMEGDKE